jgi:hypothetical protein
LDIRPVQEHFRGYTKKEASAFENPIEKGKRISEAERGFSSYSRRGLVSSLDAFYAASRYDYAVVSKKLDGSRNGSCPQVTKFLTLIHY